MEDKNYSLKEVLNYGRSLANRGIGYGLILSGGWNLISDVAFYHNFDLRTMMSSIFVATGVACLFNTRERIGYKIAKLFRQEDKAVITQKNIETIVQKVGEEFREKDPLLY